MHPLIAARIALKAAVKITVGAAALPVTAVWSRAGSLRVFYYHRVNDHPRRRLSLMSQECSVSSRRFRRQLDYLIRRGCRFLSADEVERALRAGTPFPPRAVLLTFDDGYADNYDVAFPLLRERGVPALFFLATNFIDTGARFPWDRGGAADLHRPLNWAQVAEMAAAGMDFGSHTQSHADVAQLPAGDLAQELTESKRRVEQHAGKPAAFLAYPAGRSSPEVAAQARRAGHAGAFTCVPRAIRPGDDAFALGRHEVSASDPMVVFALKLRGALAPLALKEGAAFRRVCAWITPRTEA